MKMLTERSEMSVSVIMALYNPDPAFLQQAVASVLHQTHAIKELILVNDGGSEDFRDILPEDSRIKIFTKTNEGVAATRNFAITQCASDYIAFLDQDDYWFPNKLQEQLSLILNETRSCIIVSPIQIVDLNDCIVAKKNIKANNLYQDNLKITNSFLGLCYGNYIYSSTPLIHCEIFNKVGYFDITTQPHDDWDMYLRILYADFPIYMYKVAPLSVWRIHQSNESHKIHLMLLSKCRVEEKLLSLNLSQSARSVVYTNLLYDNLEMAHLQFKQGNMAEFRAGILHYLPLLIKNSFTQFNNQSKLNQQLKNRLSKIIYKSIRRYMFSYIK